ncbi:MAG: preprotein translocase subunit SecE [Gammaproteobacteria bacterium CG_4_10_14_0_8_um_filter_38_16]|nr:MAG: preprotein translocase subunit SecE [Gammaproteobacteria bacterium CG_4_10_14_0_8_um_filter_38_16]PJA02755.1 MAG: preprotein translocase subunit SecE [Gammaproteobacteria bacterium CG_4_10_14_0_2_um_filter_38_22]PJB10509.1 MAG: preprotein translocase subunit SecE [Gammaproteobacteria bacterium CG_4_9_14_3_um_filter_38_9]
MDHKNNIRVAGQDVQQQARFNGLKWTIVSLLVIGGIVANTYFSDVAWALRAAAGILIAIVALLTALQTTTGRVFWSFAKAARVELRKVVWPTRQETFQTTLIVVAMVVFAALVLWGLDTVFFWLVGWLTGQRG